MIRWGLIGCGDVTEHKSGPAYQHVNGFELCAVSARTPGKAQDYAKRHQVHQFYSNAQALINDPNVDAVYIATPPDSHLELALQVAQANKICCIEKPMAVNAAQARRIHAVYVERNLPLFIAYYRRCLPGFIKIKHALDTGQIGQVRHIDWQYSRPPSNTDLQHLPNWRTDKHIAPGGYFDDLASHGLNLMHFFAGQATQVHGLCTNQQGLYSAYDSVAANMVFEHRITATGSWNFASHRYHDVMTILGSAGTISLSVFGEQPAVVQLIDKEYEIEMPKPNPIQGPFVKAIAAQLINGIPHPSQGDSAVHTNWIMDRILGGNI